MSSITPQRFNSSLAGHPLLPSDYTSDHYHNMSADERPFPSLDGQVLITPELMLRLDQLNGGDGVPYRGFTSLQTLALFAPGSALRTGLNALYWTTALISLLGNLVAIGVLRTGRRYRPETLGDMRIYLLNLALSDLGIALLCLPFTYAHFVDNYWPFAWWLCRPVAAAQTASIFAAVYTLTAISVTSFVVTWWPLHYAALSGRTRVRISLAIWLAGCLLGLLNWRAHQPLPFRLVSETDRTIYYDCRPTAPTAQRTFLVNFAVTFLIPVTVLMTAYLLVIRQVATSASLSGVRIEGHATLRERELRSKRRLLRVLLLLVGLFFLCWMPIQVWFLVSQLEPPQFPLRGDGNFRQTLYHLITLAFHWLAMANSLLNPVVYYFLNAHFATDLKATRRRLLNWWNCQVGLVEQWHQSRRRRAFRGDPRVVANRFGPRRAAAAEDQVVEEGIMLEEIVANGNVAQFRPEPSLQGNHNKNIFVVAAVVEHDGEVASVLQGSMQCKSEAGNTSQCSESVVFWQVRETDKNCSNLGCSCQNVAFYYAKKKTIERSCTENNFLYLKKKTISEMHLGQQIKSVSRGSLNEETLENTQN